MKTMNLYAAARLIIFVFLLPRVEGRSMGAPLSACVDFTPQHPGTASQTSPSPYSITFTPTTFSANGGPITVTLTMTSGSTTFKGFLLAAQYDESCVDQTLMPGNFTAIANTKLTCNNGAVTHSDRNTQNTLSFQWSPPATSKGHIRFRATFVQGYNMFWVNVRSSSVLMDSAMGAGQSACTNTPPPTTTGSITKDAECGLTKGCYSDCSGTECRYLMTWAAGTTNDNVRITMSSKVGTQQNRYIAFGLSNDKKMGDDSVNLCYDDGTGTGVFTSYNEGRSNALLTNIKEGLGNMTVSLRDGILSCSFTRNKMTGSDSKLFALDKPYTIFWAEGTGSAFRFSIHDSIPIASAEAVSLQDFTKDVSAMGVGQSASTNTTSPTAVSGPPLATGSITKDAECGLTKGCYSDCSGTECRYLMTWAAGTTDDNIRITMSSKVGTQQKKYIAFGLSNDKKMGDDSVNYCYDDGTGTGVFTSYNEGKSNARLTNIKEGLGNMTVSLRDGILSCSFTRNKMTGSDSKLFALDKPYTIFWAEGPGSAFGISTHNSIPVASSEAVSLQDFTKDVSGGVLDFPLVKAHGSLMMAAWVFCASIGIVLARYYKNEWQDSKWCGQKVWFQIHRTCMVLCFTATVVAFIIIFVYAEGYSEIEGEGYKKAHPIMGIIVTCLAVINPVMAIFRPHPGTKNRPIFNWLHWAVGITAYTLAIITVFFGMELDKAGAPDYIIYILIAFVVWHFLIQIILEVIQCQARSNTGAGDRYEMADIAQGTPPTQPPSQQGSQVKPILLYLHILVVTAFTITLIVVLNVGEEHDH